MAKQRTLEAQGAGRFVFPFLPLTVDEAKKMTSDPDIIEANDAAVAWDAFNYAEVIMTRPFISVIGAVPGSFGDGHEIYPRAASREKKLLELPGVTHYQLYDEPKAVKAVLDKVLPVLKKHLGEAN